ncbi:hypothetical protein V6N13_047088 [Hibiscus sabdariffa]
MSSPAPAPSLVDSRLPADETPLDPPDAPSTISSMQMECDIPVPVEYESLPMVCFQCGIYGHHKVLCPKLCSPEAPSSGTATSVPMATAPANHVLAGPYGPWMLVERKKWISCNSLPGRHSLASARSNMETMQGCGSRAFIRSTREYLCDQRVDIMAFVEPRISSSSTPDRDFIATLFDDGLHDLGYQSLDFTWYRGNCVVQPDRCICNDHWLEISGDNDSSSSHNEVRSPTFTASTWSTYSSQSSSPIPQTLDQEELLWKQKSCSEWVKFGDRNTAFFHKRAIINKRALHISSHHLDSGDRCSDEDALHDETLILSLILQSWCLFVRCKAPHSLKTFARSSSEAYDLIASRDASSSSISLVHEIVDYSSKSWMLDYVLIKREANFTTDFLAKFHLVLDGSTSVYSVVPAPLMHILVRDLHGPLFFRHCNP